jgi:hypothetical protein
MNLQDTNEEQKQKQKRQEGKNKCKDKNLDNTSRLIEALAGSLGHKSPGNMALKKDPTFETLH